MAHFTRKQLMAFLGLLVGALPGQRVGWATVTGGAPRAAREAISPYYSLTIPKHLLKNLV